MSCTSSQWGQCTFSIALQDALRLCVSVSIPVGALLFFGDDTTTPKIYTSLHTLSLHDALPISRNSAVQRHHRRSLGLFSLSRRCRSAGRSEEHTSELQSRNDISYAVFCLK